MIKNKAWINAYILKVDTKPDCLLNWQDEGFNPHRLKHFQQKLTQYPRVYLELGSGSGGHLIERAASDREALYLGVELRYKRAFRTIEKAEKRGIENLAVLRCDAKLIPEVLFKQSLSGIYINFPDPWNKRRWHKHRMLSAEFLPVLHSLLHPDGFLAYKTDHLEAFEDARKILDESRLFVNEALEYDLYASPLLTQNIPTEFEMLFRSKGLPIYFWRGKRLQKSQVSEAA